MITRRLFLGGIIAAPAIVRFESLMPIRYIEALRSNALDPVLISIIRKNFMRHLANELCSIQPMFDSAGNFFAVKSKYSDNRVDIVPTIVEFGGGVDVSDIFQGGIESYTRKSTYKSIGKDDFHIDVPLRIDDKSRDIAIDSETGSDGFGGDLGILRKRIGFAESNDPVEKF